MPIHEVGYRTWENAEPSGRLRWWVIAQTGILLAWKSQWARRMLFFAWLPAIYLGMLLFGYEQATMTPGGQMMAVELLSELPNSESLRPSLIGDPDRVRSKVWGFILLTFFRYPQGVLMVMLVGLIAPSLIARDMRSRAFLLYFSRPLSRVDYVFGKSVVVWAYLAMITTVPATSLYVLGVLLSPDLSVISATWDLPLRILAASVWLIVPTTAVSLCFSSLTTESRYAAFAWFGVWVLGWVAYVNLTMIDLRSMNSAAVEPTTEFSEVSELSEVSEIPESLSDSRWTLVSLYHSLGRV